MNDNFSGIKAILLDLDNTIFDHDRVQKQSLFDIYNDFSNVFDGVAFGDFFNSYLFNNEMLWNLLVEGKITRDELRYRRFADTLNLFDLDYSRAHDITRRYIEIYRGYHYFIANARETLEYLKGRYRLGIITNGFSDIQYTKIDGLGISGMFDTVLTSEDAGVMKPHPEIFLRAAKMLNSRTGECLCVGDSYETDVCGAAAAGIRSMWFNSAQKDVPEGKHLHDHIITELGELITLL